MPLLAFLARVFLIRRLFRGRSSGRSYGRSYGRPYGRSYGYGSGRRRGGFGTFGPFPTYSRRTRSGARVSVGGCCLPIPLTLGLALAGALRLLARR